MIFFFDMRDNIYAANERLEVCFGHNIWSRHKRQFKDWLRSVVGLDNRTNQPQIPEDEKLATSKSTGNMNTQQQAVSSNGHYNNPLKV